MSGLSKYLMASCLIVMVWALWGGAEPERLDFGPFELANPSREARIMVGPDEPKPCGPPWRSWSSRFGAGRV